MCGLSMMKNVMKKSSTVMGVPSVNVSFGSSLK